MKVIIIGTSRKGKSYHFTKKNSNSNNLVGSSDTKRKQKKETK